MMRGPGCADAELGPSGGLFTWEQTPDPNP